MSTQSPTPPASVPPAGPKRWWNKRRLALATVAIAAIAAVGAVLEGTGSWGALVRPSSSQAPATTPPGNCNVQANGNGADNGSNNGNGNGSGNSVVCNFSLPPTPSSDATSQAEDERFAKTLVRDVKPTGSGPWPFVVLMDYGIGLKIRSSPEKEGFQIGRAEHRSGVWVQCYVNSSFDADPSTGGGTRWYKVRWPHHEASSDVFLSGPSDPLQGWAYAFYLTPNGTNGQVPACH